MDWLNNKIWPIESKMNNEDISYATYSSCIEMINSGTTTCADFIMEMLLIVLRKVV
jgi:5-methylthioadenosine/S-adenosylhomocysteine deaminase